MGRARTFVRLGLWMNGLRVGSWEVDRTGRHHLTYDDAWLANEQRRPVSLSMPLFEPRHSGDVVQNFFENLLPDSRLIRERIQVRFSARSIRAQDLLQEVGRDCAGALAILPEDELPEGTNRIEGEPLTEEDIVRALARVTSGARSADPDDDDFRISIAGAQEKTAFLWAQDQWHRPRGATPSTHIFKLPLGVAPSGIDLGESVQNEWLCGQLLAAYGVPVALGEMARFGKQDVLIVPRFDRQPASDGTWLLRLPQEDFAQVFGVGPDAKYESEGGPGIAQILHRLSGSVAPTHDREDFFRTQVLFWMLAAIDGHAKNFSVFIEEQGSYQLTPRYDVLSAHPVMGKGAGKLSPHKINMAMAVWGNSRHYRWKEIRREHFEKTAIDCGLGGVAAPIIDELAARTADVIEQLAARLPRGFPDSVAGPIFTGLSAAARRLGG